MQRLAAAVIDTLKAGLARRDLTRDQSIRSMTGRRWRAGPDRDRRPGAVSRQCRHPRGGRAV